ncbi:hypothetical protein RHCRD62_80258 [Rhodococcus sp. RD6.2]|nr:hypothetical protein RHCRD62_80258 [Rhodococcus sp. RD6.2]
MSRIATNRDVRVLGNVERVEPESLHRPRRRRGSDPTIAREQRDAKLHRMPPCTCRPAGPIVSTLEAWTRVYQGVQKIRELRILVATRRHPAILTDVAPEVSDTRRR